MILKKFLLLRMGCYIYTVKSLVIYAPRMFLRLPLLAEFKWGEKKYPPRDADTTKRDNGICFYMPLNEKDFVWPKSIECQVQEGDVGDMWLIDSATVVVNGKQTEPKNFTMVKKKKIMKSHMVNGTWWK
jgi:hypothetical protein